MMSQNDLEQAMNAYAEKFPRQSLRRWWFMMLMHSAIDIMNFFMIRRL